MTLKRKLIIATHNLGFVIAKEVERMNERGKGYTVNDFVYHNPNTDRNTSFHMRKISVGENMESLGNFWNVTKRNMR